MIALQHWWLLLEALIAGTIIIIMIRIIPRQTLLPWLSMSLMLPVRAISVRLKNGGRIAINDFCRRRIHQSLVARGTIKCVGGGGVQLRASMWFILLLLLTCCCAITLLTSWCIRPIRSNGPCRHILVPPGFALDCCPHTPTPHDDEWWRNHKSRHRNRGETQLIKVNSPTPPPLWVYARDRDGKVPSFVAQPSTLRRSFFLLS